MEIMPYNTYLNVDKNPEIYAKKLQNAGKAEGTDKVSMTDRENQEILKTCQEFEAIFLNILYKEMKKTVPDNPLVPKSSGTRLFEDMYLEELANQNSKSDSIGIAKMLYDQFTINRKSEITPEELKAQQGNIE